MLRQSLKFLPGIRGFFTAVGAEIENVGTTSQLAVKNGARITVVMPVYNAAPFLEQSLEPLLGMIERSEIFELIVVDDHSTDDSAKVAKRLGARVLSTEGRSGPGAARNLAASHAAGDILWFVDADVIVHADAASKIAKDFSDPTTAAVFGSYDDRPPARNFLSQYKNLIHRYYHQHGKREASTFWAGCGAIRKAQFLEARGFDTERYNRPSIEDIELGYRLRANGHRILLNPSVQGTHLKHWSFFNLIHTEVIRRAIPWSRLMLQESGLIDDLNVSISERLRAVLAGLLALACIAAITGLVAWWVPVIFLLAVVAGNWQLTCFFYQRRGALFTVGALLFHQLYYLYSAAAYAWAWLGHQASRLVRS